MESRIEELEVSLRIAEARAEIAIDLVRRLTRNLGLAELISWTDYDLIAECRGSFDTDDPARDFAMLDLVTTDDEDMGEAHRRDMLARERLRADLLEQIRHDRAPS